MGQQAIFLSDEEQDLEGYSDYSNDHGHKTSVQFPSMGIDSKRSTSPLRLFMKWALICTFIVLAMSFTSELLGSQDASQHSYYGEIPKTCSGTKYRKTLSFDFNRPTDLVFTQESHGLTHQNPGFDFVRVNGKVEVLKQDSLSNIRVALDIRSSDPQLTSSESLSIVKSSSGLTVKTPRRTSSSIGGAEPACIYVAATISIPTGTTLENFGINTETLSVTFYPGLDYAIANSTEVRLISVLLRPSNESSLNCKLFASCSEMGPILLSLSQT